jgi:hypothetical protein
VIYIIVSYPDEFKRLNPGGCAQTRAALKDAAGDAFSATMNLFKMLKNVK